VTHSNKDVRIMQVRRFSAGSSLAVCTSWVPLSGNTAVAQQAYILWMGDSNVTSRRSGKGTFIASRSPALLAKNWSTRNGSLRVM
jgi:hypothetical protein